MTPAQQFLTEYARYCQAHDLTCPTLSESGVQAALSVVTLKEPKRGPIPFPYARKRDAEPRHIKDSV